MASFFCFILASWDLFYKIQSNFPQDFSVWKDIGLQNDLEEIVFAFNVLFKMRLCVKRKEKSIMDFSVWKDIILENGLEEFAFAFNARPPPLGFILIKACAGGQYGAQSVAHIKRKGRAHFGLPKGERSIKEAEKS